MSFLKATIFSFLVMPSFFLCLTASATAALRRLICFLSIFVMICSHFFYMSQFVLIYCMHCVANNSYIRCSLPLGYHKVSNLRFFLCTLLSPSPINLAYFTPYMYILVLNPSTKCLLPWLGSFRPSFYSICGLLLVYS